MAKIARQGDERRCVAGHVVLLKIATSIFS